MARSLKLGALAAGVLLALPLIAALFVYTKNTHSFYWDLAGEGPGASVVARLGQKNMVLSGLPHQPAFGEVLADSGFARAALKEEPLAGTSSSSSPSKDGDNLLLFPCRRSFGRCRARSFRSSPLATSQPLGEVYDDPSLRGMAVEALGAAGRGTPEEMALLKRAFGDESEEIRRQSVAAAAAYERRLPGRGAPLLSTALRDSSAAVRTLAFNEIGSLPDAQAVPLLTEVLARSNDGVLRRSALEAISAKVQRTPSATSALGQSMSGPARAEATEILEKLVASPGASGAAAQEAVQKVALDPRPQKRRGSMRYASCVVGRKRKRVSRASPDPRE